MSIKIKRPDPTFYPSPKNSVVIKVSCVRDNQPCSFWIGLQPYNPQLFKNIILCYVARYSTILPIRKPIKAATIPTMADARTERLSKKPAQSNKQIRGMAIMNPINGAKNTRLKISAIKYSPISYTSSPQDFISSSCSGL